MKKADKTTTNEALQKRQKMFSEAEKLANIGIFEWDIRANQVSWSDGLYHIYGLKPDEFGASFEAFLERIHPPHRERVRQTIETAFREGKPFEMEELIVRPNGEKRVLFTRGEVIQDADGQPIRMIGVCQDVTERKKAERARLKSAQLKAENTELEKLLKQLRETQAQLVQSEKMASLGSLVAGLVHEMNSPIGSLNSNADVDGRCVHIILEELQAHQIFEKFAQNKRFTQAIEALQKSIQANLIASGRLSEIVNNLRSFAHLDEASLQEIDIHQGLESTLTLLKPLLKDRIVVKKAYDQIPKIVCYAGELNQVFMTVLRNAAQAVESEGSITIKTFVDNGNVCVQVTDTGAGIPPERMKRLFEPAFSEKDARIKAGMGLFTALSIIEKHRGQIKVHSETGKGTTVSIVLPTVR